MGVSQLLLWKHVVFIFMSHIGNACDTMVPRHLIEFQVIFHTVMWSWSWSPGSTIAYVSFPIVHCTIHREWWTLRLQSMGSQKVGHDWVPEHTRMHTVEHAHTHAHTRGSCRTVEGPAALPVQQNISSQCPIPSPPCLECCQVWGSHQLLRVQSFQPRP